MSVAENEIHHGRLKLNDSSVLLSRLQESLDTCSKALEAEDFRKSDDAIRAFVDLLDYVSESALSVPDSAVSNENAVAVLSEIQRLISSASSNEVLVDRLSLELPKIVAKFAGVSDKCGEIAESIIDSLVSMCSPRDMLSILSEALESLNEVSKTPISFVPILNGLSKVFLCIQRHHFKQIKVAVPAILSVLKAVSLDFDDENKDSLRFLFNTAVRMASSIQEVSEKLVGNEKEKLCALLGLYILQNMALISKGRLADKVSSWIPFMLELSNFLPFCGLSYIGLITGYNVEAISTVVAGEDDDDFMSCFDLIRQGACLTVISGHISDEVAKAAREDLVTFRDKLLRSQVKRWQAVRMLRHLLSSIDQPWKIKDHGIDFLLSIVEGPIPQRRDEDKIDWSSDLPRLFTALQAIEQVIMYASDAALRKKAFSALKRVLADIPSDQRFDMLKALILNDNSPSAMALLMDIYRDEIVMELRKVPSEKDKVVTAGSKGQANSPTWSSTALELVEHVLKPPKGGPPSLPEHSDAVVSALNLYRFLLIAESTGKTNYMSVLSESNLRKAYTEWFLPLRTLVSGMEAENQKDYSEIAVDILYSLNLIQLVLYRCIELVEENLKISK